MILLIALLSVAYFIIGLATAGGFLAHEFEEAKKRFPKIQNKCSLGIYCSSNMHRKCEKTEHFPKAPTLENALTQNGWIVLPGLFWPIGLAGLILYAIAWVITDGLKHLVIGSGKIMNWTIKEVSNPKENVKEIT